MLKQICFFVLFFVSMQIIKAQEESNIADKKTIIGIQFAPKYSFRALKPQTEDGHTVSASRNKTEAGVISYNIGLGADYFFRKKMGIGISALYSENGEQTQPATGQTITQNGFVNTGIEYWFVYKTNYIDVPLKFNYIFLDRKRLTLFTTIGFINNIFLNQKQLLYKREITTNTISKTKNTYHSSINAYSLSFAISAGIDFNIHKFKVRIQPGYDRFILPATSGNIKTYYYNISLGFGVYYTFL